DHEPLLDPRGRTFCYCADDTRYIVGGPTSGAGASIDWVTALLLDELPKQARFARAAELAAHVSPGADGLIALPFFGGERAPYWDSTLRGVFDGIDLAHDRRTLLRAVFEGVVFGVRAVYDVVRELAGDADRLLLTGGLTKAPLVRQMLADIFGMPAAQPKQEEASALAAALLAAQAIGLVDDAAAAARDGGYDAATEPNPSNRVAYETAFAHYRAAVESHVACKNLAEAAQR
ncbi:MAG TPA: FGGY-family carbohydrate kinase, partial [Candidatus Acidoferrum sp.]|nr:FGGY-family carbohydrate kinase [Candidatus Acidoferrum sp.]